MTTENNKTVIYESPDGGNTVYARNFGNPDKILVWEANKNQLNKRLTIWYDILVLADSEPSLNDLLNKAEMLYEILKKENE